MERLPIQNFNTQTYRFLSNFYPCLVVWRKRTYPSAEHAYQAMKTRDPEARRRIASLATPGEAKKAGRRLVLRADWEDKKERKMPRSSVLGVADDTGRSAPARDTPI